MRTRGWAAEGYSRSMAATAAVSLVVFLSLSTARAAEQGGDSTAVRSSVGQSEPSTIQAALDKPISFEFKETPLADAVDSIEEKLGVDVYLDLRALAAVAVMSDTPVTCRVNNISARAALRPLLRDLDLTYIERDGVLYITTPEEADADYPTVVYDVSDLVYRTQDATEKPAYEPLIDVLTDTIVSEVWDPAPGSIAPLSLPGRRLLVISQSQAIHEQVADTLEAIRAMRHADNVPSEQPRPAGPKAGDAESSKIPQPLVPVFVGESQREKALRKALVAPIEINTIEMPLEDLMHSIEKQIDHTVWLDTRALKAALAEPNTPITARLSGISLRSALELVFAELGLTHVVQDEMILITTPGEADATLVTAIYDVSDFADQGGTVNYRGLIEAITPGIAPIAWEHGEGGLGWITGFEAEGIRALVVAQTEPVHEAIQKLLDAIRKSPRHPRAERPVGRAPDSHEGENQAPGDAGGKKTGGGFF